MCSEFYECSKCYMIDKLETLIEHFIQTHVGHEEAQWICSLCNFKAESIVQLHCHTNYFCHQEALKRNPAEEVEYIKSQSRYEVQIGRDIFLYREDEPVYNYGVNTVFDYKHESVDIYDGSSTSTDYTHEQTHGERNTRERSRTKEGGGGTCERRLIVDEKEGTSTERKMKFEEREEKGRERKRKLDEREGSGGERKTKSEDRVGKGGERKRKSEDREGKGGERKRKSEDGEGKGGGREKQFKDREGNGRDRNMKWAGRDSKMIGRRNTSGNGEQNGKERRLNHRTSEPDKTKTHLTSLWGVDTLRGESGHAPTNDSGTKEKTNRKKNLEEDHGTGSTQIHNEAQKAVSTEPAMLFSSEQANLANEPVESAQAKDESDIDLVGETSQGGTVGEPEVSSLWEEGVWVGKITELIQSLQPLKNISKALIAIEHHMRGQSHTGTPLSTEGVGVVGK